MKAKVNYKVSTITEIIDLTDYGYDDETIFEDLTDDQQHEIEDSLRNDNFITVGIETIKV